MRLRTYIEGGKKIVTENVEAEDGTTEAIDEQ